MCGINNMYVGIIHFVYKKIKSRQTYELQTKKCLIKTLLKKNPIKLNMLSASNKLYISCIMV